MENTLSCPKCGFTLIGNSPTMEVLCNICSDELRNAYPDGWTCCDCGNEYHNEFPANYPPEEGTLCKNCI